MTTAADGLDGIEALETTKDEIEESMESEQEFKDGTNILHVTTDDTHLIPIGESVGNPILVEADHFLVIDVETERELGPQEIIQKQMQGEDIEMPEDEDDMPTEYVDEATVVVSNEDGIPGGGVLTVDGGSVEDALTRFAEENL